MGTGADVAIASAGITLVKGDLAGLARARRLSHATMRNIRQNLVLAFLYNALGIPIAAGVLYPATGLLLSPMIAAAAMSLSSVSVISNALRLALFPARVMASDANNVIALYERHARTWDKDRVKILFERPWLDRFRALMPAGGSILDIGCGSGEPIAGHFIAAGFRLTGADRVANHDRHVPGPLSATRMDRGRHAEPFARPKLRRHSRVGQLLSSEPR